MYLVAPLSLLLTFKGVYKYPKEKTTKVLIIVSLIMFTLLGCLSYYIDELGLLWMSFMAFALQIILYQKELKLLFNRESC